MDLLRKNVIMLKPPREKCEKNEVVPQNHRRYICKAKTVLSESE